MYSGSLTRLSDALNCDSAMVSDINYTCACPAMTHGTEPLLIVFASPKRFLLGPVCVL